MGSGRTEPVELTVAVMVTDPDGRMLVQDRVDPNWHGLYFPGGHVEPDESFVHAAIREVWEETGLTIKHPVLCGVKQFPGKNGRYVILYFKTETYSGTLQDSGEGKVFWIDRKDLPNYELTSHFLETVEIFCNPDQSEFFHYKNGNDWSFDIL